MTKKPPIEVPVATLSDQGKREETGPAVRDGVWCCDCLLGMAGLPDASVDFVFADLPYGCTQNVWDRRIDLGALWVQFRRICKPTAAFVFTAMQPFASLLVCSNFKWFRYERIWHKNNSRGFLNAKRQPLRVHENVLVFYKKQPQYVPQMTNGHPPVHTYTKRKSDGTNYGRTRSGVSGGGSTQRYPTSVLKLPVVNGNASRRVNSTQKPPALAAEFIRTYTRPSDVVLDPTAGSGSTLVAAKAIGRRYIGFDIRATMVDAANGWLAEVSEGDVL